MQQARTSAQRRDGVPSVLALRAGLQRTLLFGLGWLALTGADGLAFGSVAAVALALASLIVLPPRRRRVQPLRLLVLVPLLLWYTLQGGVDVALRALRPGLPVRPGLVDVELEVRGGPAAVALVFVMTLLPGTLVADFTPRGLRLHVIDRGLAADRMSRRMERTLRWALEGGA